MHLTVKTLLNLKEGHARFVYRDVRLCHTVNGQKIEVNVDHRKGSKGICSGCGARCSGYDRLPRREFTHVPLWGIAVVFCTACGGSTAQRVAWWPKQCRGVRARAR